MTRLLAVLSFATCAALFGCSDDTSSPATDADPADGATADTGEDSGQDAEDVGADVVAVACGSESPAALAACVEADRWSTDADALSEPRVPGREGWQDAQDLCAERFEALGYTVERQDWGGGVNVIGTRTGTTSPEQAVVIGAHYDTTSHVVQGGGYCPGADDNGSAVAGVLEIARVLATTDHARTVVVACWDHEEGGLLGSQAHAERASANGEEIVVALALEMIGYASDEPNSQMLPDGFALFFPDTVAAMEAREWRGDFLAAIGDVGAQDALDALVAAGEGGDVPVVTVPVPAEYRAAVALADLRRSDHASFWDEDYPAIMLTDTANFRNPNYHCVGGPDSRETLNTEFAAGSIANIIDAAATLLAAQGTTSSGAGGRDCQVDALDSCGDGMKCSIIYRTVVGARETCVEHRGDLGVGEECNREEFGIDDCAPGLVCTTYERSFDDQGDATPACRALCTTSADCGEGERCQAPGSSVFAGVCVTDCNPADQSTCPENSRCQLGRTIGSIERGGLCAGDAPSGTAGAACEIENDCGAGFACALETGTCTPWCDAETPCDGGAECVAHPRPHGRSGLGYCRP